MMRLVISLLLLSTDAFAELAPVVVDPDGQSRVASRRLFEISSHVAGAASECERSCEGLAAFGYGAGVTGLIRPTSEVAFVLGLHWAWFRWTPKAKAATTIHVTTPRIGARAFVLRGRRFEGWVEATLHDYPLARVGLGSSVGIETFVSDHFKIGPLVQFDFQREIEEGESGGQATATASESPLIRGVLRVGLTVSVPFGPMLSES